MNQTRNNNDKLDKLSDNEDKYIFINHSYKLRIKT
jgi:hypothetical protein